MPDRSISIKLTGLELGLVAEGIAFLAGAGYGAIGPNAEDELRACRSLFHRIVAIDRLHSVCEPGRIADLQETVDLADAFTPVSASEVDSLERHSVEHRGVYVDS
jgi:hypothetical protein